MGMSGFEFWDVGMQDVAWGFWFSRKTLDLYGPKALV